MNKKITLPITKDNILELIKLLKNFEINNIAYFDDSSNIELTTLLNHRRIPVKFNDDYMIIINDSLFYTTEPEKTIYLIHKIKLYKNNYNFLFNNFIKDHCEHLNLFLQENDISEYEEILISFPISIKTSLTEINFKYDSYINLINNKIIIPEFLQNILYLINLFKKLNGIKSNTVINYKIIHNSLNYKIQTFSDLLIAFQNDFNGVTLNINTINKKNNFVISIFDNIILEVPSLYLYKDLNDLKLLTYTDNLLMEI